MSKKSKTKMSLVLEGKVFIVERLGKKELSREELNGETILKCVLHALTEGLKLMEKDMK